MSEQILIDTPSLCKMLNIGKSKLYEMISTEQFGPEPVRAFGRKTLYKVDDVIAWKDANFPNRERFKQYQKGVRV